MIFERIGALNDAIDELNRKAARGGMEAIDARSSIRILTAMRDELTVEMNGVRR